MPTVPHDDWSPADHPYAIAVSEAQWWRSAVDLAAARLDDPVDQRSSPMGSHQIDARNLVLALSQLLTAERLEQYALSKLGVDQDIGLSLSNARTTFLEVLPGIEEMRNALTHFDEWSKGTGRGAQKRAVKSGEGKRAAARRFWSFGFDRSAGAISHGPYQIEVAVAVQAAARLSWAIGEAARRVDQLAAPAAPPEGPPAAE